MRERVQTINQINLSQEQNVTLDRSQLIVLWCVQFATSAITKCFSPFITPSEAV